MSSLGRLSSSPHSLAAQSQNTLGKLAADIDAMAVSQKKRGRSATTSAEMKPESVVVGFEPLPKEGVSQSGATPAVKPPSKALTKAERRAIQEAQRAAKAARLAEAGQNNSKGPKPVTSLKQGNSQSAAKLATTEPHEKGQESATGAPLKPANVKGQRPAHTGPGTHQSLGTGLGLFGHLTVDRERSSTDLCGGANGPIHPTVLRLGLAYNRGKIVGSNARCRAMMVAFKEMINDYEAPVNADFGRDLEQRLRPQISFLSACRPMASSMRNAVKFLKMLVVSKTPRLTDAQAKAEILDDIDTFIRVRIDLADEEIAANAAKKLADGDVVLTYACSYVVCKALINAHQSGRRFKVIVVDGRPRLEGKQTLKRLTAVGIECSYVQVNAASYIMREATKVFLGAATFFTNGHMLSRVGTAVVAMMAKACAVPVIVCCETYKFWDRRVQTDSFVYNEVEDSNSLVATNKAPPHTRPLENCQKEDHLQPLRLLYDVTPSNFIDMVITEVGCIPCTSVPVVLREYDITKNI